tara:strand:- start:46 stop:384 length:339 start_codon:yes stop_codon:yes gene_type:complete
MLFIVRLILAGASRASIIAKHGKKAYDAAKKLMKTKDKSIWSKLSKKDAEKYIFQPIKETEKKLKKKNILQVKKKLQPIKDLGKGTAVGTVASSPEGIKTYAKGGGIRKPKY